RKLALPVRLAHMVEMAGREGREREASELAVLLTERGLGGNAIDLDQRLGRFRHERSPRADSARLLAKRLAASVSAKKRSERGPSTGIGDLLIHAWPDRVAKARGADGRFLLANGRGAMVDMIDPLAKA